jgi:uncharacterized protein (TIGR04255 family)
MARIRHLRRAPIAEAVVEVRVRPIGDVTLESVRPLVEKLKADLPIEESVEALAAKFGVKDGKPEPPETRHEQLGVRLWTADRQRAIQVRRDLVAISQLKPYTSWEDLRPRAIAIWRAYADAVSPATVTRVGVRYINEIRLGLPSELSDYFIAPPIVPSTLPQMLRTFMGRQVLHDVDTGNSVIVTQAIERSTDENHMVVLLDIDAFRDLDDDARSSSVDDLLESLRELKNQVFFGSITERTAEMYA